MFDFLKINGFETGKRDSFEALLRVIARRNPPKKAQEYQPNDGRGGDGGVEALWLLTNGKKVGYQSKFFETLGDPQWKQMDKSVAQAIKTHPELTKYVFALPLDLTPKRGPKAKGKSQQEKWDDRVETWKALAAKSSIKIEFELWNATVLTDKLMQVGNGPLQKHWFGVDVLDDAWFKRHVDAAILKLDDRFNPNDHVDLEIDVVFDYIVRNSNVVKRINDALSNSCKAIVPDLEYTTTDITPDPDTLTTARDAKLKLETLSKEISSDPAIELDFTEMREVLASLQGSATELRQQFERDRRESKSDKKDLDELTTCLADLTSACYQLDEVLRDQKLEAEASRCAIVYGEAGAGKSHVLGEVAFRRMSKGLPTIVVLGQDLSRLPFWSQLGSLLGVEGKTSEDILGMLNAVGERKGVRTLLLFDAINEGAGADYWINWLPEVIDAIKSYKHIAAVFSCRDVYLPYAVPKKLLKTLPRFLAQGFSSPEEQEQAAIQYLDKKGILRPNTPWLSPEFNNPLFLKSTSEALAAKGETEFPRGFQGISRLMTLYLDGLSARMGIRSVMAEDLSSSLRSYVKRLADKMADDGQDFVEISIAKSFAAEEFADRQAPEGKTWLDVLIQANLLRRDPPPFSNQSDRLNPLTDLIRFPFQRFQHYLIADALVAKVAAMKVAGPATKASRLMDWVLDNVQKAIGRKRPAVCPPEFQRAGPLNFIFNNGNPDEMIQYDHAGLIGALSTIYPEKLGVEFAMTLPSWQRHWEENFLIQSGFGESFKWRGLSAFTEDTTELLNLLDDYPADPQGLLLEVSMTVEHPWNAERLHTHLERYRLAERDSHWTQWINWSSREELSQIDRIVSWALSSLDRQSDERHLQLASLVLAWSLSSSHMTLRDRATKALTTVFLKQSDTFEYVLNKMYDCDDPYIIERLYAAAFGACCIDPNPERLEHYSQQVFAKVFADGKPPVALLTRDYALGVIELAESKNALGEGVQIAECYHPFGSDEPEFGLTKEQVEEVADQRGGKSIFQSASSKWGDYGKYSIPGRVSSFLTTRLMNPAPISASEIKDRFEAEVISPHPERVEALEVYRQASILPIEFYPKIIELDIENGEESISKEDALSSLQALLSDDENQRLTDEYFNDAAGHGDYSKVSVNQCRLWITKRAYELGWTKELFPRDGHGGGSSRYENDLERIGKKYQRIALDELQARLADNYWSLEGLPESPHRYRYSHNGSRRNIEPTVLPTETRYNPGMRLDVGWMSEPKITLPEIAEVDLRQWPFTEDPTTSMSEKLVRVDENGKRWLVLYEFHLTEENYGEPANRGHGKRYDEFRFFYCVFLKKGNASAFAAYLAGEGHLNVSDYQPRDFTNGPYLGEAYWRDTWQGEKFDKHIWKAPAGCEFAIPISNYHWESNLDKTLPDGFSNYMPQKWFADELALNMSPMGPQYFEDDDGNLVIQSQRPCEHQTAVVIDEAVLLRYADEHQVEPIWIMIAERNTWPGGVNGESSYRRSEGAVWLDGADWQQVGWNNDTNP